MSFLEANVAEARAVLVCSWLLELCLLLRGVGVGRGWCFHDEEYGSLI